MLLALVRFRADKNGCDVSAMTSLMKVMEVQGVVDHLVQVRPVKGLLLSLELDYKDQRADDHDCIDPLPHARDCKLQIDRALKWCQSPLQNTGLLDPCVTL